MKILAYLWIFSLVFMTLFVLVGSIIEKNFDESHSVKKWWRRNAVGFNPKDDIRH